MPRPKQFTVISLILLFFFFHSFFVVKKKANKQQRVNESDPKRGLWIQSPFNQSACRYFASCDQRLERCCVRCCWSDCTNCCGKKTVWCAWTQRDDTKLDGQRGLLFALSGEEVACGRFEREIQIKPSPALDRLNTDRSIGCVYLCD